VVLTGIKQQSTTIETIKLACLRDVVLGQEVYMQYQPFKWTKYICFYYMDDQVKCCLR